MNKYIKVGIKALKGLLYYVQTGQLHKLTPSNIKGYFQGLLRLEDFYTRDLNPDTEEQFLYRISVMNPSCISNGMCPCQCEVPAKQIEDRACELNCYPAMMNKEDWEEFKRVNNLSIPKIREIAINKLLN